MKRLSLLLLACFVTASTAADATTPTPATPSVSAKIIGGSAASLQGSTTGPAADRIRFCIASNTGRYRLTVTAAPVGAPGAFELHFVDEVGAEQTAKIAAGGVVIFQGANAPDEVCAGKANAHLRIVLTQREMRAAVAGHYATQLQYSVEPL